LICYHPRVVLRGLFLLFLAVAEAQTWEEAVRSLVPRVTAHLAANETAHVTSRNLSSLGPADATKVQVTVERALHKRVRNPAPVDVSLTISENVHGYLLVAEIRKDVEMASFRMEVPRELPRAAIAKILLWEQDAPILDVLVIDDQMLILDINGVTRYDHRSRVEGLQIPSALPRDARGKLEVANESLTMEVPGSTCRGTWKPLALTCESGGEFSSARNTLETTGSPPYFSRVRVGETDVVAETDGRTHLYDASHKPVATVDEWGSDLAAACLSTRILATGAGDRESRDSLALYEIANRAPVRVSDPVEFPGPVTALSSSLAIARNLSTGRYEAYSLTVDYGH
jgi:hypothetical protein